MAEAVSPRSVCPECLQPLRWERIEDRQYERWMALCRCGLPWVFVPSRPEWEPDDPLAVALASGQQRTEPSPPWIRLFQVSSGPIWWRRWQHIGITCPGCSQRATFGVRTLPRVDTLAYSRLCLVCGHVTVEHAYRDQRLSESPVSGSEWVPPCVAVARLRRAVFTHPPLWRQQTLALEGSDGDE